MKVIVLTGGGTAGHVTPNLALLPELRRRDYTVHYIGSAGGIEKPLIDKAGVPFHTIRAGKLRRYFDVKNLTDIFRVTAGFCQSLAILRKLKPGVVFSKGGFVSCPVVWAAWLSGIPVVIHESDITPGLTNRLSMPFAKRVCYTFPESTANIPGDKGVLTGLPIREGLLYGDSNAGKSLCGFTDMKPVILVVGGSQGAESINDAVRRALPVLLKDFQVCHICGKGNSRGGFESIAGYKQYEYVREEQPHLYAMADIVVSRAGATTLYELLALGKPNLLIPLPKNASRGDQIQNAQSFQKQGFSSVLPDEQLTAAALSDRIWDVYRGSVNYKNAMALYHIGDACFAVLGVLEAVISD